MYAQNCARNGPVTDVFLNTFTRWKWGHMNKPVLNDAGVKVDTSATFEQALMSDELLSNVAPCNQTFHLSKQQQDFDPAAFDIWTKGLSEGGGFVTLGCTERHQETWKTADPLQFGWKERVYTAYGDVLSIRQKGGSPDAMKAALADGMPPVVHIRDQGGHLWEKGWRLAQMGWQAPAQFETNTFGQAYDEAVRHAGKKKTARMLRLHDVEQVAKTVSGPCVRPWCAYTVALYPHPVLSIGACRWWAIRSRCNTWRSWSGS